MSITIEIARKQYYELGFDTLPLVGGSKAPYPHTWQKRPSNSLWQSAPQNVNIGIRGGGVANVAFIDCDEPKAFESVTNYLAGLGLRGDSYPLVQTASSTGRHIYITLTGTLPGEARDLSKEIGAGEFRYGAGAFVVAPPSVISDGSSYQLLSGDFQIRPILEVKDILPLVSNQETSLKREPTLSRKAIALLHGKGIDIYSSRSEAEQSLLASIANAGLPVGDAIELFNRYPCAGKYAELKAKNPKNAKRWLSKSYNEALQWVKTHESKARLYAMSAITWAESTAWQGKTGAVDRLIYLAHANIAYKAGRLSYAAACRDLADMVGVSHMTATRSTWRLCNLGLLIPEKKAVADCANTFQLGNFDKPLHSLSTSTVRKCNTMSNHDVFRYGGLGKSAGEIYAVLQVNPATVDELARYTGRHVKTIERVLERLARLADPMTGEYFPMVTINEEKKYSLLPSDLNQIARMIGTSGKGEKQKHKHEKDRRLHARELEHGRNKQK